MAKSYTVHDLPPDERPRERLQKVGIKNLSAQEILALVIERGGRAPGGETRNVLTIAQNLLAHFGNLQNVKTASLQELQKIKGIGFANACKLKAAFELGAKAQNNFQRFGQKIETAEDVFNLLKDDIGDKKKEHMKLISLDSKDKVIDIDNVSIGTLNSNLSHPREIFKKAIRNSAAKTILVHNHPSGDPDPSQSDKKITEDIFEAGEIIGIDVSDHIIIGKKDFFSFKDKNIL